MAARASDGRGRVRMREQQVRGDARAEGRVAARGDRDVERGGDRGSARDRVDSAALVELGVDLRGREREARGERERRERDARARTRRAQSNVTESASEKRGATRGRGSEGARTCSTFWGHVKAKTTTLSARSAPSDATAGSTAPSRTARPRRVVARRGGRARAAAAAAAVVGARIERAEREEHEEAGDVRRESDRQARARAQLVERLGKQSGAPSASATLTHSARAPVTAPGGGWSRWRAIAGTTRVIVAVDPARDEWTSARGCRRRSRGTSMSPKQLSTTAKSTAAESRGNALRERVNDAARRARTREEVEAEGGRRARGEQREADGPAGLYEGPRQREQPRAEDRVAQAHHRRERAARRGSRRGVRRRAPVPGRSRRSRAARPRK